MGAGASTDAKEGYATRAEVEAYAGGAFDAEAWAAAPKDGTGRVPWSSVAAWSAARGSSSAAVEGTSGNGYVYGAKARRASVSAAIGLIEGGKDTEQVLDALAPVPGMDRAARVFATLSAHVSSVGDTLGSGFAASYKGKHINYARLFKACDVDGAGTMAGAARGDLLPNFKPLLSRSFQSRCR